MYVGSPAWVGIGMGYALVQNREQANILSLLGASFPFEDVILRVSTTMARTQSCAVQFQVGSPQTCASTPSAQTSPVYALRSHSNGLT